MSQTIFDFEAEIARRKLKLDELFGEAKVPLQIERPRPGGPVGRSVVG
jgi:hypothetical protein